MRYLLRPVLTRLLARLTDRSRYVREEAAKALAGRQDPRVTQVLLGYLTNRDRSARRAAAEALVSRQDPAVTQALLGQLTDEDKAADVDHLGLVGSDGD